MLKGAIRSIFLVCLFIIYALCCYLPLLYFKLWRQGQGFFFLSSTKESDSQDDHKSSMASDSPWRTWDRNPSWAAGQHQILLFCETSPCRNSWSLYSSLSCTIWFPRWQLRFERMILRRSRCKSSLGFKAPCSIGADICSNNSWGKAPTAFAKDMPVTRVENC